MILEKGKKISLYKKILQLDLSVADFSSIYGSFIFWVAGENKCSPLLNIIWDPHVHLQACKIAKEKGKMIEMVRWLT